MDAMPDESRSGPGPSSMPESPDWRLLLRACAERSPESLGALYDAAAGDLYALALWITRSPEDASDVVADVFVTVAEQGSALAGIRRGRAWLFTVVRRRALDVLRAHSRRRQEPMEAAGLLVADASDPDRNLEAAELSAALHRLSDPQREVLYLHHFADCTFAEIGRIVGVSMFTAASRHRLALRRLRQLMGVDHGQS
jgi:RNA polymerase sigma-70 factor (ECF subfamily)